MVILLFFLTLTPGICSTIAENIYIKAGDLVMLHCGECEHDGTVMLWKMETEKKTHLYSNLSASEQQQLGLVVYQNSLVILSASLQNQGNYSCSPLGNTWCQMGLRLTIYSMLSKEYKIRNRYNQICYTNQACKINCPEKNIPTGEIPSITSTEDTWHKENGELSKHYFPNAELEQSGVYICTRSFLYSGETYNTSFTVELDVQTGKLQTNLGIYSPKNGQVFEVELGKTAEINCIAVIDSCENSLFWLKEDEFVENNDTLRYFYNTYPCNMDKNTSQWMNASLVFREVLEEDLSTEFNCKLESDELSQFVKVTIEKKEGGFSYLMLTVCTVCIIVVIAVIVVTYVKYKIDLTLFLRDHLGFQGCQNNTSHGRSYDAFLMCYKSDGDGGLSEEDRKLLASTLEDQFGYSLCIYDRDVLPGQAESQVLECVEQSRAVVLVPGFPDPEPGNGVLSAIYAAIVEGKTDLIFINTKTNGSRSGSFPEALQLLSKAGNTMTWKGGPPSLSFLKQLRYHLQASQQTQKMQLLTQDFYVDT